jgi:Xaa-Pro aminopeptidase
MAAPVMTVRSLRPMRAVQRNAAWLRENMVFICKPSAITADNQYICTWGDTVVITKNGGRRLGKRPHDLGGVGKMTKD